LLGLLTRPFDQKPADALVGAGTAVGLAGTFVAIGNGGVNALTGTATDAATPSLALVAIWMVVAAVSAKGDQRGTAIARGISVISFWIAATAVLILLAGQFYPDDFDHGPRRYFVFLSLLVLVPLHMWRSGSPLGKALVLTIALWASTGFLTINLVRPPEPPGELSKLAPAPAPDNAAGPNKGTDNLRVVIHANLENS